MKIYLCFYPQSTTCLLNNFSEHRIPSWNFHCLLVSNVAVKKPEAIYDPLYAIFFFFSMETKFRNFTVKCLSLFSTICQVAGGPFQSGETLDPETFSSIIFLRLPNIFFSVLFPFNSSYSDVYPPWTVKPLFPFSHVLLLLFVLFLEKFLNFIF